MLHNAILLKHLNRYVFSSPFTFIYTKVASTPSLPNGVTYPHCFLTAYKMTSCPSVLAGKSDSKNQTHTTDLVQEHMCLSALAGSGVSTVDLYLFHISDFNTILNISLQRSRIRLIPGKSLLSSICREARWPSGLDILNSVFFVMKVCGGGCQIFIFPASWRMTYFVPLKVD